MPSLKHTLQFIIEGGAVQRFHTRPGIRPSTDAAHSWGVAMLASLIASASGIPRCFQGPLLMATLTHDLGEQVACDVSSPAKRALGLATLLDQVEAEARAHFNLDYSELPPREAEIIKLADNLEGMLYCCQEAALGNRNMVLVFNRYCSYVAGLDLTYFEHDVFAAIVDIWRESNGQTENETAGGRKTPTGPGFDCYQTSTASKRKTSGR